MNLLGITMCALVALYLVELYIHLDTVIYGVMELGYVLLVGEVLL